MEIRRREYLDESHLTILLSERTYYRETPPRSIFLCGKSSQKFIQSIFLTNKRA